MRDADDNKYGVNGYTVMLPEAGIRQVTVTSNGGANWDFVIDNIRFSPD